MGLEWYFALLISVCFWILIELSSTKDELRKIREIKEKEE